MALIPIKTASETGYCDCTGQPARWGYRQRLLPYVRQRPSRVKRRRGHPPASPRTCHSQLRR